MHRRSAPALGLRTSAHLMASGLFGALALIILCAGHIPAAFASSEGYITIIPSSGPVGTAVEADINLSFDTPQPYILSATATDPAQGGCASAQPFPGLGPVTVSQQGGHAQFTWPDAFASGQYWLCASPQGGTGPSAHSLQPYTVTAANAPSPTPASGGHLPESATSVIAPDGGVPAGSTVKVVVVGWVTPDNATPTAVKLVLPDNSTLDVSFTVSPTSSAQGGSFTLAVTVPATTTPGDYHFEIDGAYQAKTLPFHVVAPVTPTVAGGHSGSTGPGSASGGIPAIAIGAGVALLLLLASAILVAAALGRKRAAAEERQRQRAHDAGRYANREEAWRR